MQMVIIGRNVECEDEVVIWNVPIDVEDWPVRFLVGELAIEESMEWDMLKTKAYEAGWE